jgi:hypothetical protein
VFLENYGPLSCKASGTVPNARVVARPGTVDLDGSEINMVMGVLAVVMKEK